ncbi:MAG: dockerin type I domain-containing protein [bacterium]|nr:dockerin type I domain-containing protein [bacterium]
MRTGSWLRTLVALAAVLVLAGAIPAAALDVTVSATVEGPAPPEAPPTAVVLKGIAYPSSTVTVLKNSVIAVQVPADPQAKFDVTVGSLAAGSYTFGVYGTDAAGRDGPVSNFTVTLTTGTTVTITGIFLGPTISADKTSLKPGETITLLGTTSPSSAVHVFVSSTEEKQFDTQAAGDGGWSRQILASDLVAGTHTARSKAVETSGEISAYSDTVTFTIASTTPTGPTYIRPDLNQDGKVDLIDFSILLYYWGQRNPNHPRVDINQDSVVNIIDFSIMLFYWTAKPV